MNVILTPEKYDFFENAIVPVLNSCVPGTAAMSDVKEKSFLIVDDEDAVLFAFKDILSELSLAVDTAQSIEEVRLRLSMTSYDGAVIDLRLGGSNGFEGFDVIRLIRNRNPQCTIILLTAYARPGTRERAIAEGADHFMEKPVSPEKIRAVLMPEGAS